MNIKLNEKEVALKDVTYNYTNLNRHNIVLENPRIIHFTGADVNNPWAIGCRNPFRHTYWKYRKFIDPVGAIKFKLS